MANRKPVISTNIAGYDYDADAQTLEIEFHNGKVFRYENVPKAVADGFEAAQSKGSYFAQYIKRSYYGQPTS